MQNDFGLSAAERQRDLQDGSEQIAVTSKCEKCGNIVDIDNIDYEMCDECRKVCDVELAEFLDTFTENEQLYIKEAISD